MRTIIYIDGFNLFNRSLKKSPYKWLDLKLLATSILKPHHDIQAIKYFTSRVSALGDPRRPTRQKTYIRALETYIPNLEVHYGHFLTNKKVALIAEPPPPPKKWVMVYETKEKGSDVKLAVHLLNDAWHNRFDCAVILSNDSDLAEAIKLVKEVDSSKMIGWLIPHNCHASKVLKTLVDFQKQIRPALLAACQLPETIPGKTITKPRGW